MNTIVKNVKNLFGIIDRSQLMELHVDISRYVLPRVRYMRDNLNVLRHVPLKCNELGEIVGTLELEEWGMILDDIVFALTYDVGGAGANMAIPSHDEQEYIKQYMERVQADDARYKRGFRLLGLYYTDLWG